MNRLQPIRLPVPPAALAALAALALACLPGTNARAGDAAADPPATAAPTSLPVREVTVFKDGHAFVLRKGTMAVDEAGNVVLDRLPTPVLGTFWPFSDQVGARLVAVRAGSQKVQRQETVLGLQDLLAANVGASVIVTDDRNQTFHARVAAIPTRSGAEIEAAHPNDGAARLDQRGSLILLETDEGIRAMRLDQVREVVFRQDSLKRRIVVEEVRNRLTLLLSWEGARRDTAEVGMMYLQKGLRWIPGYRVDLLDGNKARIRLQATLVNDLADLDDVGVNLVIGVPTFAFANTPDPIGMQAAIAQMARRMPRQAIQGQMLSNAIMTQVGGGGGGRTQTAGAPSEVGAAASDRREDLYVFRLEGITLQKGERMVVPVAETVLPYEDVYTLEIPFTPPPTAWPEIAERLGRDPEAAALARRMAAPKVMHEIRLTNEGPHPLTTAPALVFQDGKVLAQGLLGYTSVGGKVDLPLTTAVDIRSKKADVEKGREPTAVNWAGYAYARIDMEGEVELTNHKRKSVHVEVTRFVLGNADTAGHEGRIQVVNSLEDTNWTRWPTPVWWGWYRWPSWWYHFNGASSIDWSLDLAAGETVTLGYTWHYYWR